MDNPTGVQRWLAVVRVATGGVFVYMGTGHLLGGLATADGFQKLIAGFAKTDPIQSYTSVMVPIAGEALVAMMTDARGASNAKAKRELAWRPTHPSWAAGIRSGVTEVSAMNSSSAAPEARTPRRSR